MSAGWLPDGAALAVVTGGLAGAVRTSERWASVSRPDGLTISPSGQGARIGFTQSF